jgi:hypothetical protein
LANHDAAIAAIAELTTLTGTSECTLVEWEIDNLNFVRSSRWIAHCCWVGTIVLHV